jgi:tetratricopeptide (TPR) repeat protein
VSLRTKVAQLDPFSRAFHVFGLIVEGHPDADREMEELLEAAGDNYRVHLAVLEALRLSNSRPAREQGERMLELLDRPALRGSTSPDLLYRRAFALRRLGRYEAALEAVDDCLARLPVQQVQDRVRIIQEHDLIMAERAIAEQRDAAEKAAQESLARHSAELRALVSEEVEHAQLLLSDALFRVVEVLGLFIAVVALLAGSVASAVAVNLLWWQRGALIVVAALVVLAFFLTLRVVVHPSRRRNDRRRQ